MKEEFTPRAHEQSSAWAKIFVRPLTEFRAAWYALRYELSPERSGEQVLTLMPMNIGQGVLIFIVLLFSLSVHESAHAWAANKLGDSTARRLGRLTLNPIAHIDPFMTILLPILTIATLGFPFGGAKPVPINPLRFRHPTRDYRLVSAAGVTIRPWETTRQVDLVVDALFGGGFRGELPDLAPWDVQAVPVVAVDVPSGLSATSGAAERVFAPALATVTFHGPKVGHLVGRGPELCGEVVVADIGLPEVEPEFWLCGDEDAPVPNRRRDRKSTRLNSSHTDISRMPSSA